MMQKSLRVEVSNKIDGYSQKHWDQIKRKYG
jgi:hypothetical protein